ncbi:MAG: TIGR00730 family Rossman fold protein [Burkholderiales bacterium]|jgi:uncharacterized protein (TIGR00730 family)
MDSADWDLTAINRELLEAERALRDLGPAVAMFGSSRTAKDDSLYSEGQSLAKAIASAGYAVITGGGPGLMDAFNRGAQAGGSPSVGLGIRLPTETSPNPHIDIHLRFERFFTRKAVFVRYAQAFVVMPGGWGTLDELFEILCLVNTGKAEPVPVILVGTTFWENLLQWLEHGPLARGTIGHADMRFIQSARSEADVLRILAERLPLTHG